MFLGRNNYIKTGITLVCLTFRTNRLTLVTTLQPREVREGNRNSLCLSGREEKVPRHHHHQAQYQDLNSFKRKVNILKAGSDTNYRNYIDRQGGREGMGEGGPVEGF